MVDISRELTSDDVFEIPQPDGLIKLSSDMCDQLLGMRTSMASRAIASVHRDPWFAHVCGLGWQIFVTAPPPPTPNGVASNYY